MIPDGLAVFVATFPIDLRAGFDRLAGIVSEQLRGDPRCGSLYLFTNKRRTHIKALFFDRTGYCVLYKRLDRGQFPMPTVIAPGSTRTEISSAELEKMLEGLLPLPTRKRQPPTESAMSETSGQSEKGKKEEPTVH